MLKVHVTKVQGQIDNIRKLKLTDTVDDTMTTLYKLTDQEWLDENNSNSARFRNIVSSYEQRINKFCDDIETLMSDMETTLEAYKEIEISSASGGTV